jgi:glycosyltransferase involved in cell wall biosynthesis
MVNGGRPKVIVLLSAFCSATFIAEQLASILAQQGVDLHVVIRDDGSDDGSLDMLQALVRDDPRITLFSGENLGVTGSFFALLTAAEACDADYVTFADQDDIWPPDRLAWQCAALADVPSEVPGLCYGAFLRVDAAGAPMGEPVLPPLPDKGALLSENQVPGCTMMLNRAAHQLVRSSLPPAGNVYIHDWWVEQVIVFTGRIVRVDDVVLHYRQHAANLIGAPGIGRIWRARLVRLRRLRGHHPLPAQIRELRARFGDRMTAADRTRIDDFLEAATGSLPRRMSHVLSGQFRRARRSDDLFLRLLLVVGYFRSQVQ